MAAARRQLAPRVAFHSWIQHRCSDQLVGVRDAAHAAGMALGVIHDLAVGVDADGADAWALADVLATGVTVGAPPDNYTPPGQDWGLPPWRPDRLAATGYGALRDMLARRTCSRGRSADRPRRRPVAAVVDPTGGRP